MTTLDDLPLPAVACDLRGPGCLLRAGGDGHYLFVDPTTSAEQLRHARDYLTARLATGDLRPTTVDRRRLEDLAHRFTSNLGRPRPVDPPAQAPASAPTVKKGTSIPMAERPEIHVDTDRAHSARVYDFLLGGKTNYAPDREVAENLQIAVPAVAATARRQRAFMHRQARYAASQGIMQYLDIGTGIPTEPNLHQVVQAVEPAARVLYVDNDPIVLRHAEALMTGTVEGHLHYLHADAHNPDAIVATGVEHDVLRLDEPMAVSFLGLLHFLDDDTADQLIRSIVDPLPAGSLLAITQSTSHGVDPALHAEGIAAYERSGIRLYQRDPDHVARWLAGLDLIDPGIVRVHRWRPDADLPDDATDIDVTVLAAVARKP